MARIPLSTLSSCLYYEEAREKKIVDKKKGELVARPLEAADSLEELSLQWKSLLTDPPQPMMSVALPVIRKEKKHVATALPWMFS